MVVTWRRLGNGSCRLFATGNKSKESNTATSHTSSVLRAPCALAMKNEVQGDVVLVHPDKNPLPEANAAFEKLTKACKDILGRL